MKNKLITIMITISGLLFISAGLIIKFDSGDKSEIENVPNTFEVSEELALDMCVDVNNCDVNPRVEYSLLSIKYKNDNLDKIIKKINSEVRESYEKAKNSNLDSPTCLSFKNKYLHSLSYTYSYYLYEGASFVTIAVEKYIYNLCSNEIKTEEPKVYIFSKEKNEIIDQIEFRKTLNVSDEKIESEIKKNISMVNMNESKNYTYQNTFKNGKQDLKFFYNYDGKLNVYYKQYEDNTYWFATLDI